MMTPESYLNPANRNNYYVRYLIEISFWLLVNLVILNIVSGIIIDSFSKLRLENETLQNDKSNVCYICGLNKNLFDSYGIDFTQHI